LLSEKGSLNKLKINKYMCMLGCHRAVSALSQRWNGPGTGALWVIIVPPLSASVQNGKTNNFIFKNVNEEQGIVLPPATALLFGPRPWDELIPRRSSLVSEVNSDLEQTKVIYSLKLKSTVSLEFLVEE
jgi:hypothetical protein